MSHSHEIAAIFLGVVALTGCPGGGGNGSGGNGEGTGSLFLIAGNDGDNWYGTTPGDWTEVLGIPSFYDGRGVAFGNGRYVWTGERGQWSATSSTSLSDDFDTTDFGGLATVYQVAFGNGVFVAVGEDGGARSWVSSDGQNWTTHFITGFSSAFRIAFGDGRFVIDCTPAVSPFDGRVCYSSDGMNWTGVALNDAFDVSEVGYGNGMFVAVGADAGATPLAWTSNDGVTWTAPVEMGAADSGYPWGVAYGNGTWVVVGESGRSGARWTSPDAINWSFELVTSFELRDVAFGAGTFVAVGGVGNIRSSTDGVGWSNVDLPGGGANLTAVTFVP